MDKLAWATFRVEAHYRSIRVLMVDDSLEFLVLITRFLSLDPVIEIVGMACTGGDAIEQVVLLHPDVVLMDVSLPDMSGLEVTQQIKAQPNAPCVIISTFYGDAEYRAAAKAVFADGFVAKSELGTEMLPLIHKLCDRHVNHSLND